MKILLICAAGMSTSMLMKRMVTYWEEQGVDLIIDAVGMSEYSSVYQDYEIILVGPQVSYRLDKIKEDTGLPCEAISSVDYGIAKCDNIMKLAEKLYAQIDSEQKGE